jgi:hypothetical protein
MNMGVKLLLQTPQEFQGTKYLNLNGRKSQLRVKRKQLFSERARQPPALEGIQAACPRSTAMRSSSSNSMCFPNVNSISFLAASKLGA